MKQKSYTRFWVALFSGFTGLFYQHSNFIRVLKWTLPPADYTCSWSED